MATLLGGRTCVDPRALAEWCAWQVPPVPTERWLGRANAFTLEPGRNPGRGRVLLRKSDLDLLDFTSALTLTFSGTDDTHVLDLLYITVLQRECIVPGSSTDPNSVYLCEVVDRRHHLARVPLPAGYRAYNVRAADDSAYLTGTLNSGVAWTWQGVVNDLVTTLGESTSAFVLPFTPDGTPQNLVFDGVSAWEALNRVLDRLACVPVYDPTTDTFSVVRLGEEQDAPLTAIDAERTWDGYSSEEVRGWRPEKVRVRFLRRPQPSDGASPYYTVDVTLTATTGVVSGTYVQLDDDATAEGVSGTPSNSAALATRAQERADDWLRKRQYYERPVLRVWLDFQPKAPGVLGHAVGRVAFDDRGGPFSTAVVAEPDRRLEDFRPLGNWPAWWPLAASSSTGGGDVWGPESAATGAIAFYTDPNGRFIGANDNLQFLESFSQYYTYHAGTLKLDVPFITDTAASGAEWLRRPCSYMQSVIVDEPSSVLASLPTGHTGNFKGELTHGLYAPATTSHPNNFTGRLVTAYLDTSYDVQEVLEWFVVSDLNGSVADGKIYTYADAPGVTGNIRRVHSASVHNWMVHYSSDGTVGWSGTFTVTQSGVSKTCTVKDGIITSVA